MVHVRGGGVSKKILFEKLLTKKACKTQELLGGEL